MRELVIGKNDAGQRLDKFLSKAVKGMPTSIMYKSIRTKKIKVNRKRAEQNTVLAEGDTVQLFVREEFFDSPNKDESALERIAPKLNIVYEDENILLLNKRQGVLVHEDTAGNENTLIMHIKAYLLQKGEYNPDDEQSFAPALCNRIDRNTGGIVIAAKKAESLRIMNEKIKAREIDKFYLASVHGIPNPPEATIEGYLIKDEKLNTVRVFDLGERHLPRGAKKIATRYKTVATSSDTALIEVELLTGRTHQIRAHMAFVGHPLVGDGKYGRNNEQNRRYGITKQALCSYRLIFRFGADAQELAYLQDREFTIDDVWFAEEFYKGNIRPRS